MKTTLLAAAAVTATLAFAGAAAAEDFPATPMNSGPMDMNMMMAPMMGQPAAAPAPEPMMQKPMMKHHKRMMMKKKMMMEKKPMQ